jgi:hypothetical protein
MESLSSRLHRIKITAEGLAINLRERGEKHGHSVASSICNEIEALEHEAQRFEIEQKIPRFADWKPL